jgi:RNA polymerase sigma factor (sigma-70 family)
MGVMSNSFDNQLVEKLKNGDQESFALLFDQYSKKIYSLAYKMCGNNEDAEDIVQQTFIQALAHIGGFNGKSSLYTWLYAIAKNLCLRLLENRKRSSFSSLEGLIFSVQAKESPDNFSIAEKQYYINQVKEGCLLGLLRCLSFYQRIAFILNVLLGLKVKDVSIVIGKTENATRLLIHRAKHNLKGFLCRNCSLYDVHNPCHCENLIHFSLKQGWIRIITDKEPAHKLNIDIAEIENEINGMKKMALLYNSLEDPQDLENIVKSIQQEIMKQPYKIFSGKK